MLGHLYQLAQGQGPVAERAAFAVQITEQHQAGEITDSEYQELMLDLSRLEETQVAANELEARTILLTAIWALAQLR